VPTDDSNLVHGARRAEHSFRRGNPRFQRSSTAAALTGTASSSAAHQGFLSLLCRDQQVEHILNPALRQNANAEHLVVRKVLPTRRKALPGLPNVPDVHPLVLTQPRLPQRFERGLRAYATHTPAADEYFRRSFIYGRAAAYFRSAFNLQVIPQGV
jgi:hypothetical protein